MSEKHEGACFCGAVRIELLGPPIDMGFCHCRSCREYSGAPVVAFMIWPAANVRVTQGADLVSGFNKVGTSDRRFCSRCGAQLMLDHPHLGMVDVRAPIPTVRFVPKQHLNYGDAVIAMKDGLPKFRDMPAEIGGSGELVAE